MLSDSYVTPSPRVPSPRKTVETAPVPFFFSASPIPVATGTMLPEYAVRVEVALAQVLAPALAAARSGRLPHHLGEQPERVVCEGEVVPVTAVVGEDDVALRSEVIDDPDRVRLLADVRVRRPHQLPLGEEVEQRLLEAADEEHPLVERGQAGHR